jgi:DNA-binding CsgD family transcriptional regulator
MIASAPSPGAAGSMPFAGRESELATLDCAAEAAGRGEPRTVIVEGHAGMGKSALLGEFARRLPDGALLVRVSGAEPESRLPYWLVGQLLSGVESLEAVAGRRAADAAKDDALTTGAGLVGAVNQAIAGGRLVVLVIDDLHWADPGSAAAILHALRRMQGGTLLLVAAARPRELGRLGSGSWSRFVAGDHRAIRLCLSGLGVPDVRALARAVGLAGISDYSAARLVHGTAGRPGYCWAFLNEAGLRADGASLFRPLTGDVAWVPPDIVDQVEGRAGTLSPEAHGLLEAAAVLGFSCSLTDAAQIAGLADRWKALAETAEAGLLAEGSQSGEFSQFGGLGGQLQFADRVSLLVIYRLVDPTRRRELHRRAAEISSPEQRLRHWFAAAVGPDPGLSEELERAGRQLAGDDSEVARRLRHRFAAAEPESGLAAELDRTDRWLAEDDQAGANNTAGHAAGLGPRVTAAELGDLGEPGGPGVDGLAADQVMAGSGSSSVTARRTAAVWLAQAAALAADRADRDRLLLDAVELLLRCGEAAAAGELAVMITQAAPAPRRNTLLGWLDLLTGRFAQAEERLTAARRADQAGLDPVSYAHATTGLLWCRLHAGRLDDAVLLGQQAIETASRWLPASEVDSRQTDIAGGTGDPWSHTDVHRGHESIGDDTRRQWSGQAVTWAESDGDLAIALACARRGTEAKACFGSLPTGAGEVPMGATGVLAARGIVRVVDGAFEAAVTDLLVVADRLEAGCAVRLGGLAMGFLAEAEYQLGGWSAAAQHAGLALRLTEESGRAGELSLVHAFAALVPVSRGDWEAAAAHIEAAGKTARGSGTALGMAAWASARAGLALARGDDELALRAAQTVRDTGREEALSQLGFCPWPLLEAEALIAQGRTAEARVRLKASGYPAPDRPGMTSSAHGDPGGEPAINDLGFGGTAGTGEERRGVCQGSEVRRFTEELAALRLYGLLAADSGDGAAATAIFAAGRGDTRAGVVPFQLAQLEMAAGRGLRLLAQRPEAIAWLREARGRLVRLGAAPALAACDQELAACGVQTGREVSAATLGLTPTELAVASLVAAGRSNRQAAAELYISIKGIEFHLRNIFAKLGIRSRKDLADRLGDDADVMTLV